MEVRRYDSMKVVCRDVGLCRNLTLVLLSCPLTASNELVFTDENKPLFTYQCVTCFHLHDRDEERTMGLVLSEIRASKQRIITSAADPPPSRLGTSYPWRRGMLVLPF